MGMKSGEIVSHRIPLGLMPQQPGFIGAEEDWTGITSPAQRRKLQNRLNQRARRKRKAQDAVRPHEDAAKLSLVKTGKQCKGAHTAGLSCQSDLWRIFASVAGLAKFDTAQAENIAKFRRLDYQQARSMVNMFDQWAQSRLSMGSPNREHLLLVVKVNVFRAIISNSDYLGLELEENLSDDALSPFSNPLDPRYHRLIMPPKLAPTALQRKMEHHPWIDLLPIPEMRDNLLRAEDSYDDLELCTDLMGYLHAAELKPGLLVWGEPWDPKNWEVTEWFVKKWGLTLRGCSEMFEYANFWRTQRGEEPVDFERLLPVCEEIDD